MEMEMESISETNETIEAKEEEAEEAELKTMELEDAEKQLPFLRNLLRFHLKNNCR